MSSIVFYLKKLRMWTAKVPWIGQVEEWSTDDKIADKSGDICQHNYQNLSHTKTMYTYNLYDTMLWQKLAAIRQTINKN